ncbi:MAG: TetR/AcrR family transcriptional regulator [Planctomycetes bacterium]|nr:TetR/AcrR family transcriptional regulator [Planctomycetota bacterium]
MSSVADETRARLLKVAGPLFAQHGFRDTGVKTICDAADCNVAAVNYHFHSKQDFYGAVLAEAHQNAFAMRPMPRASVGTPAAALTAWLSWWMESMLHPGRPEWLQTLMAREMAFPTPALDQMVKRSIRPIYNELTAIVRRLLPRGSRLTVVRDCVHSVIGQVLVYKHAAPVLHRLSAMPNYQRGGLARLVANVVTFSLAGIAAIAAQKPSSRSKKIRR